MDNKQIPFIEWFISEENDDSTGIEFMSIVKTPAHDVMGVAFSKLGEIEEVKFSVNEDKQIIAGPFMIPNKHIYRTPKKHLPQYPHGFWGYYTEETVRMSAEKFAKTSKATNINFDHTDRMVPAVIIEHWIIEDVEHDKSRMYGFNLPVGTWFGLVKIMDQEFWQNEVKQMGNYSFSIQGSMYNRQLDYEEAMLKTIANMSAEQLIELFNNLPE